jgi:P4 family phage/plasmid primase-like protien
MAGPEAHRRDAYCTKMTAASPGGTCPLWNTFLDRVTDGDREFQAFLSRMVGYGLTADTREHALFFLYGTGANGKSVFLSTVAGILNDYAKSAAIETFIASPSEHHPTDLAGLQGARLVTATETEDGRRWAESKIKTLTGGDRIAARFMRQDFFEFTPVFKLVIAGNHKPGLRSVDEAIRRRLHLVPFTVTIPPAERDLSLSHKLRAEWGGILGWALEGCLEWQARGLNPPASVRDATEASRPSSAVPGLFTRHTPRPRCRCSRRCWRIPFGRASRVARISTGGGAAEAGQAGAQGIPGLQGGPRPPAHPRLDLERAHVAVPEGADRQREPRGDWVSRRGHARQAANGVADHAASEAGFLRRSSLSKSQGATRKFCRAPT